MSRRSFDFSNSNINVRTAKQTKWQVETRFKDHLMKCRTYQRLGKYVSGRQRNMFDRVPVSQEIECTVRKYIRTDHRKTPGTGRKMKLFGEMR